MYELYAKIRDEKGLKDADVARLAGMSRASLSEWKSGKYSPKFGTLEKIADALGVSAEYLAARGKASEVRTGVSVPVLGFVTAGIPISAITDIIGEVTISQAEAKKGEYFALKVKDDSMEPMFLSGDIVIVRSQSAANNGDIVICQVRGGEAGCKRILYAESGIILQPLNVSYLPVYYSNEDIKTKPIVILGKVIESRRSWE